MATDASVNDVAKALDAGYTNNELYTSLNVGTTAELNSALKQVSGSQATTVFREARVLSNRFSMLADAAPKVGNGLAFNVVAKAIRARSWGTIPSTTCWHCVKPST